MIKEGDILKGEKRGRDAAYHMIIYLKSNNSDSFLGVVLTHSEIKDNILMKKEHFIEVDKRGKKYEFSFNNTYLVKGVFIKPGEWGPFEKIGELTKEGIKFIKLKINNCSPFFWDDYINQRENGV